MKYYIVVDTVHPGVTYKSEVDDYTEQELTNSIDFFRTALCYDDNILITNNGNSFVIRTKHVVSVAHIKGE